MIEIADVQEFVWISVKYALPPVLDSAPELLVAVESEDGTTTYGLATYDEREDEGEHWIGVESLELFGGTVTHWARLPELPAKKKGKKK